MRAPPRGARQGARWHADVDLTLHLAIEILRRAGHDSLARDLEAEFPRGADVALATLRKATMNIGAISADELRAEKLLEWVILAQGGQ